MSPFEENRMTKEYLLSIQSAGGNAEEAIEMALRMLNQGAKFDEISYLYEVPEPEQPARRENK